MTKNSNCQDRHDAIAALVLGELDKPTADEINQHINACRDCRALYEALTEEEEIVQSTFKVINDRSKAIQNNLIAQFGKGSRVSKDISRVLPQSLQANQIHTELSKWRTIMKGNTAKLAATAVILISVLVLTNVFVETNKNVVLAGVLDRVEQARAFKYKMDMTMIGTMVPGEKQEVQGAMLISDEYGMKWEMDIPDPNTGEEVTTEMYILLDQRVMISLTPEQKKYQRMEFDDDWLAKVKREKNDPRDTLKRIIDCNYTELGRKKIDGIKVEGFETTDPKFSGGFAESIKVALWVDVETWLPVLWEIEMKMNEQMQVHIVVSDFQWDIPVVASDFEPVIPEDFTALAADDYKAPSLSEEVAFSKSKSTAIDHCEQGEAYYLDSEYDQAFSELTKAIEIDPGLARAYITRGMAYNDKGEHDMAIVDFTKVIEIKPKDARAYVTRGMVYGNKGEYSFAIADYSKAIEIDSTITDAYKGRARAYTYLGEYDKAWKDVHKAQILGHPVDFKLLEKLREASGRNE